MEGNVVEKSPPLEGCRNGGVGSPVLKYSSHLTPFAKKLRAHMTLAEVLLWKKLSRCQLGVRFNRQKPIGKWVVDFYCKELRLAVEVDGASHNVKKSHDDKRQQELESLGIRFLRFWDCEIKNEIGSVIERIETWIKDNPPRPLATPPVEGNEKQPTPVCSYPSCGGDQNTVDQKSPPPEGCRNGGVGLKEIPSFGGVPERRGGSESIRRKGRSPIANPKSGSALVVVLWILIIIALIVSTFAFEMQLESKIIIMQRKRFKADQLALAGVELAKAMLAFKEEEHTADATGERLFYDDPWINQALNITYGVPVNFNEAFGDGTVKLHIDYEKGRRNIKTMTRDDWRLLFDQAGIPNTRWDMMLDCLDDWQDEGDLHMLNGAESDDPFYKKRGYECKNAPVDTVDELMLIKNWGEEVLYGTAPDEETKEPISGIVGLLTTWGDGKVNPNSASREVLNSLNIPESVIDAVLELRLGPDGKEGTDDDGLTARDLDAMGSDSAQFTLVPEYVAITSIGDVGGLQSKISCIFKLGEKEPVPLFWLEGKQEEKGVRPSKL
jgi:very-short-patch-repair endonuclease